LFSTNCFISGLHWLYFLFSLLVICCVILSHHLTTAHTYKVLSACLEQQTCPLPHPVPRLPSFLLQSHPRLLCMSAAENIRPSEADSTPPSVVGASASLRVDSPHHSTTDQRATGDNANHLHKNADVAHSEPAHHKQDARAPTYPGKGHSPAAAGSSESRPPLSNHASGIANDVDDIKAQYALLRDHERLALHGVSISLHLKSSSGTSLALSSLAATATSSSVSSERSSSSSARGGAVDSGVGSGGWPASPSSFSRGGKFMLYDLCTLPTSERFLTSAGLLLRRVSDDKG
jgi:hypothetical protein